MSGLRSPEASVTSIRPTAGKHLKWLVRGVKRQIRKERRRKEAERAAVE